MKSLLEPHRFILIGGPGGVGKTTTAAALGVELTQMGYKTVVLTVDPARRLAQALGFNTFEQDTQKVPVGDKEMYASMLDGQRYFDRVIGRFARDEKQKERVLNHPIYQTMVESLGGTQEYAAMERLLEFAEQKEFEKIIVDTPPSHNAAELISAPGRLADFMDNSVLKWFGPSSEHLSGRLMAKGTQVAMKLLRKILGSEFFDAFGTLIGEFDGMQAGFKKRHEEVIALLQSEQTAFFLVSYPSEIRFLESKSFRTTLQEHNIPLKGVLLNRLEREAPQPSDADPEGVRQMLGYHRALYSQQSDWTDKFRTLFADTPLFTLERSNQSPQDVKALSDLGRKLVS